jgi:hypothetical protein
MGISPTGSTKKGAAIGRRNDRIKTRELNFVVFFFFFLFSSLLTCMNELNHLMLIVVTASTHTRTHMHMLSSFMLHIHSPVSVRIYIFTYSTLIFVVAFHIYKILRRVLMNSYICLMKV